MQLPTSTRLPGVPILGLDATGPEYSRWRRSLKFALETRDTWKYCNGSFPMPMPRERPALDGINDTQPCLLEERRAWMRQDREVKLDIFLSLAEEVMLDVFESGPPLPPTKCNAQQMLEILDSRFSIFEFEGYHHAFCHFLNLRVDQCASLDEFNQEFLTVLEDLQDYGQPLSNTQACSAYFSKLNCTQNPWVAKMVEEWDTQSSERQIHDIIQESVLWPYVKPLKSKSSQDGYYMKPLSEDHLDYDAGPGLSDVSTLSSKASHSRQLSATDSERQRSTVRLLNKQQFDPQALREALEKFPAILDSERSSLHEGGVGTTCTTPEWLSPKEEVLLQPELQLDSVSALTDVPPLSLPPAALHKLDSKSHMRSHSAPIPSKTPNKVWVSEDHPQRPQTADPTFRRATPPLSEHPAFRHRVWAPPGDLTVEIHPALRPMTPLLQPQKPGSILRSCSPLVLSGSQQATPKQNANPPRAPSLESSTASPDTVSKVLFRSRHDYSLPPSPYSSSVYSNNNSSSSSSSTLLTLPIQGTDMLSPSSDTASSSSPSPIAIAMPVSIFSRNTSQGDKEQQVSSSNINNSNNNNSNRSNRNNSSGSIQPPISIFSLAATTTTTPTTISSSSSSSSALLSPRPAPQPPTIKCSGKKSIHKRFKKKPKEKKKEKLEEELKQKKRTRIRI